MGHRCATAVGEIVPKVPGAPVRMAPGRAATRIDRPQIRAL
jgi:hypothetical protein